ncbi:MAG: DUF922 domain-containing protein [Pseudomonadota bacterium]
MSTVVSRGRTRIKQSAAIRMVCLVLTASAISLGSPFGFSPVSAKPSSQPSISITNRYYSVFGLSAGELEAAMRRNGPMGFWASTSWLVTWTPDCRVRVRIKYTYPSWRNRNRASPALRRRWKRMMAALVRHERQHGRHGIKAARQLLATRCRRNPRGIVQRWAEQDRIFDRRTNHGVRRGVTLR